MIDSKKNVEAVARFRAVHKIKRVEFMLRPQEYEALKSAADAAGESVSVYIKRAIAERMEKENRGQA